MNDHKILRALADGLTTSTEIATATGMAERLVQVALVRMLDHEKVTRTKDATGYRWAVAT